MERVKGWFFNPGGRTELGDGVGETWSGLEECVCFFIYLCMWESVYVSEHGTYSPHKKCNTSERCEAEEIKWYFVISALGLMQPVTVCLNLGWRWFWLLDNTVFVSICVQTKSIPTVCVHALAQLHCLGSICAWQHLYPHISIFICHSSDPTLPLNLSTLASCKASPVLLLFLDFRCLQ